MAAGSEDAASVATLQKCEELLPGEVGTFCIASALVVVTVKGYDPYRPIHPSELQHKARTSIMCYVLQLHMTSESSKVRVSFALFLNGFI